MDVSPIRKRRILYKLAFAGILACALQAGACNSSKKEAATQKKYTEPSFERKVVDKDPPATPLSPEESMQKVQLPPGYRLELVSS